MDDLQQRAPREALLLGYQKQSFTASNVDGELRPREDVTRRPMTAKASTAPDDAQSAASTRHRPPDQMVATTRTRPPIAKAIAVVSNGGTAPLRTVRLASELQSRMAPEPKRVADVEDRIGPVAG